METMAMMVRRVIRWEMNATGKRNAARLPLDLGCVLGIQRRWSIGVAIVPGRVKGKAENSTFVRNKDGDVESGDGNESRMLHASYQLWTAC